MACYLGNKRLRVRVHKPQYRVRTICRSDRGQCKPNARAEDPRIQLAAPPKTSRRLHH